MKETIAQRLVKKSLSFGAMMVACEDADGMIAGVANSTANVISTASLIVGFQKGISTPSSFFIMVIPNFLDEKDKPYVDCFHTPTA